MRITIAQCNKHIPMAETTATTVDRDAQLRRASVIRHLVLRLALSILSSLRRFSYKHFVGRSCVEDLSKPGQRYFVSATMIAVAALRGRISSTLEISRRYRSLRKRRRFMLRNFLREVPTTVSAVPDTLVSSENTRCPTSASLWLCRRSDAAFRLPLPLALPLVPRCHGSTQQASRGACSKASQAST
ncbi:hypothetical protein FA95DRAFT_49096 [Auriscalpium vulgare]|uniref:Uncharacterized protein n=1 Tax=Auriscalpium vulgare TaxID=40419 RepID=A0ACB8SDE2_9AGAM|nr:hypothetical protein FA95DRAFT_49096 [Auriscalpium vulgare]